MKILHRDTRIIGTATDEYLGPELFIDAPPGFSIDDAEHYAVIDGALVFDAFAYATVRTQQRLDAHAQEHGYDGILSLCTYATSAVPRFATEGAYGVNLRDQTWAALWQLQADVMNQVVPMPATYEEVVPYLPPLNWPGAAE